ncbi:hypothetical protein GCM10009681_17660 [Luedemannella helvata]|uniref:Uncharacterized protein n=1 Tax=Luedemannella helvata TaxID=349315 RepID=A0ABN2K2B2_9ACTN
MVSGEDRKAHWLGLTAGAVVSGEDRKAHWLGLTAGAVVSGKDRKAHWLSLTWSGSQRLVRSNERKSPPWRS